MLSRKERKLYLWLAEHWAQGGGAIVDLGCFTGGSTAYLAEGCRRAGRHQPIHAYDRFRASDDVKRLILYPAGIPEFTGTNILPLAEYLLRHWAPDITLHPGEIEDQVWPGDPIEILTIDAAKTAASADRMAETFFPSLVPGHSVVVQQDFLHWKVPWIPVQMERMADWFTPVAVCPRDTVVYRCERRIDATALKAGRVTGLRDRELLDGLTRARARFRRWGVEDRLVDMTRAVALNPHKRRAKDFVNRP